MSSRSDIVMDLWQNVPVTSGGVLYSPVIPMAHAFCWSLQVVLQNGATGSINWFISNMATQPTCINAVSGMPISAANGSQAMTANQNFNFNYGNQTTQVNFAYIYFSFQPTAAGTLNATFNLRRFPN